MEQKNYSDATVIKPRELFTRHNHPSLTLTNKLVMVISGVVPGALTFAIIASLVDVTNGILFGIVVGMFAGSMSLPMVRIMQIGHFDKSLDKARKQVGSGTYVDDYEFVNRSLKFLGYGTHVVKRHIVANNTTLVFVQSDVRVTDVKDAIVIADEQNLSAICIVCVNNSAGYVSEKAESLARKHDIASFDYDDVLGTVNDKIELDANLEMER